VMLKAERDTLKEGRDEVDVMRRSRVWFSIRVGKLTCWTRLTDERRLRKEEGSVSEGVST